jgi:hypothetical protein
MKNNFLFHQMSHNILQVFLLNEIILLFLYGIYNRLQQIGIKFRKVIVLIIENC